MSSVSDIPLDDQKTWDMICEGRVKGCFQIESSLGKSWCKKVKPRSISELSDVISLIRPGVLKFYYDGKSMAQHYADRKNGIDEAKPLHEELREILKETHQVLLYQEQIMKIARHIAGFSEGETDTLRKSVGKKDAELLFSLGKQFVEGCVRVGKVNEKEAELIFDNIKASARYLFNKSHGIGYAYIAYWSAYLKANSPLKFYKNWLREAKEKIDPDREMRELISSAKNDGIPVYGPSVFLMNENFELDDHAIYFGFCNVKHVGKIEYEKIRNDLTDAYLHDWAKLAVFHLSKFNKRTVDNLIYVGTFDHINKPRLEMIHELACLRDLTDKEVEWLRNNWRDDGLLNNLARLAVGKKKGGGTANVNREAAVLDVMNRIINPGRNLWNNPSTLCRIEYQLLGCELSFSELDGCKDLTYANCTCSDFYNRNHPKSVVLGVKIKEFREHVTKSGETMCFLVVEDKTGELENIVVFPDKYSEYSDIIYNDSTVILTGERSSKGDDSFIVERIDQI